MQLLHPRHDFAHLSCIFLILSGRLVNVGRKGREGGGMMPVRVSRYCSRLPLQGAVAETTSGEDGSKVRRWIHGWYIVKLARPERRPIVRLPAALSAALSNECGFASETSESQGPHSTLVVLVALDDRF